MTFAEWLNLPGVVALAAKLDDCKFCEGEGTHTCKCGDQHECGQCEGAGKKENIRHVYQDSLIKELETVLQEQQALLNPGKRGKAQA